MWKDDAYLLDMLLSARHALNFLQGLTREQFFQSQLHQYAVAKALENIGESARKISDTFKQAHPQIPWAKIVALRHRIVHDYSNLDLKIIWHIATVELPTLISQIEPLVPPEEDNSP